MYQPKTMLWTKEFQTGDDSLDFQHKYLFDTFNKLGEALAIGTGRDILRLIIGRLKFYVEWHFKKEEDCMTRYNCPAAADNKKAHSAFIEQFNRYYDEYQSQDEAVEVAVKIHETLSAWLENHIRGTDTQLFSCIHGKQ